jgi:hypothetical protein
MTKPFNIHDWQAKQRLSEQRADWTPPPMGVGNDSFGSAGTDKRSGQVIGDIIQLIKSTDIDPMDVMEVIGEEFNIKFEFSGGAPGFKQADNGDELGSAMARTQDDARDYNSERDFLPMQEHTVTFTKDDMATLHDKGKLVKADDDGKDHTYVFGEDLDEQNTTGTGTSISTGNSPAYATPYAFKKKKKK